MAAQSREGAPSPAPSEGRKGGAQPRAGLGWAGLG